MRGFTLIELLFVIIILSLLSAVAVYYIPDPVLQESFNVLKSKILNKRSNAINFIADNSDNNITCIEFDIKKLNKDENSSRVKYHFSKRLSLKTNGCENSAGINFENNKTICFDSYGRPFAGYVDDKLNNLCNSDANISLDYKNKEKNLTIYKTSGFVR